MGFDMNSGYSGWSMSRNAVAAYHDGEMPKSKWTKKAILAALEGYCDEYDLVFVEPKGTKAELFERFVEYKSWHHTSKFCNCTDFYGLNEEEIEESFEPMDEEQIAERDAAKAAAREREEAERAERHRPPLRETARRGRMARRARIRARQRRALHERPPRSMGARDVEEREPDREDLVRREVLRIPRKQDRLDPPVLVERGGRGRLLEPEKRPFRGRGASADGGIRRKIPKKALHICLY